MSSNEVEENGETIPDWGYIKSADEKWVHDRFEWLIATLGLDRLWKSSFLTPSVRDFPDKYTGTEADAAVLLSRICGYLDLDVNRIKLGFFSDDDPLECELAGIPSNAAGLYQYEQEKSSIWLNRSELADAESLVSTISHELCHEILLGGQYLDADEDLDHEEVTDLLTVFAGFGVFSANACVRERNWHEGHLEYSETKRKGYLSMAVLAYALALSAWYRKESKPDWYQALRPDVRSLVQIHLKRITANRGAPPECPGPSLTPIGDRIRQLTNDQLALPEVIEPEEYETEECTTLLRCVCHSCHKGLSFSAEFAGNTVSCPHCKAYLDVPELAGGREANLLSQLANRREKKKSDQAWIEHNLSEKWRNYFLLLPCFFGVPIVLAMRETIPPEALLFYFIGAMGGSLMSTRWHDLKALERGVAPPSRWSEK